MGVCSIIETEKNYWVLHSSLILWLYFFDKGNIGKKGKSEDSGSRKANTESKYLLDIPG